MQVCRSVSAVCEVAREKKRRRAGENYIFNFMVVDDRDETKRDETTRRRLRLLQGRYEGGVLGLARLWLGSRDALTYATATLQIKVINH
jgi:hypothetical protein